MWKIPLFDLDYDENESRAVNEVLRSKWLSMGEKTAEFERKFSQYLGNNVFSAAVSNCTAALHLSLLANNIGKGDEVIISGLTFVASLNVVNIVGATPVLADSKSFQDWNACPDDIASKITAKTKAIIVVHYAGYPCDMERIIKVAKKYNLILIEDAAHAMGAEYKGEKCGTIGDVGCFSFFSNKNISTGEGGMLVTKSRPLYDKFRLLRSQGMNSMTIDRYNKKAISYDVIMPGLNYRFDEIRSALGIEQLKKLDNNNIKRKKLTEIYRANLSKINGVIVPWLKKMTDRKSSYHIMPIMLPEKIDRRMVINYMRNKGIQTSIHYPAFEAFSYYAGRIKQDLKVAKEIASRELTLPLYPMMTKKDVEFICSALQESLKQ